MIKLRLARIENVVIMKILEMDERLRGIGGIYSAPIINDPDFKEINIYSRDYPIISYLCTTIEIFLGGKEKEQDHLITSFDFKSSDEASRFIKEVQKAIKKINQKYLEDEENMKDTFDEIYDVY